MNLTNLIDKDGHEKLRKELGLDATALLETLCWKHDICEQTDNFIFDTDWFHFSYFNIIVDYRMAINTLLEKDLIEFKAKNSSVFFRINTDRLIAVLGSEE